MIYLLLCMAVLALVVMAVSGMVALFLWAEHQQLDIVAKRLAAEQRVEHATRYTLKAMRDAAQRSLSD